MQNFKGSVLFFFSNYSDNRTVHCETTTRTLQMAHALIFSKINKKNFDIKASDGVKQTIQQFA